MLQNKIPLQQYMSQGNLYVIFSKTLIVISKLFSSCIYCSSNKKTGSPSLMVYGKEYAGTKGV